MKYLSTAETAKLIREALKASFPEQKFSVRKDGNCVRVNYDNADLKTSLVEEIAQAFEGEKFDGMTDSGTALPPLTVNGELAYSGARFVFVQNEGQTYKPFVLAGPGSEA